VKDIEAIVAQVDGGRMASAQIPPKARRSRRLDHNILTPMERETIRKIREAVRRSILKPTFSPADVNRALGINWAGVFLPKHRDDNPGGHTVLFVQVSRRPALYRLK
jgi:hypothetical protein